MLDSHFIFHRILEPSLKKLYKVDHDMIEYGVSERSVCARLAHHMDNLMRCYDLYNMTSLFNGYVADVEYNRMGNGDPKQCYDYNTREARSIVSDLLVHRRGKNSNLLAVEMKRDYNRDSVEYDKERLSSMTKSGDAFDTVVHNTILGAFIEYSLARVSIELFIDGDNISKDEPICYEYCLNELRQIQCSRRF